MVIPINATPRFRAINVDAITLVTPIAQQCNSGVLTDAEGLVQGLWLSFLGEKTTQGINNEYFLGCNIRNLLSIVMPSMERPLKLKGIAAEFSPISLATCRDLGLNDIWVHKIEIESPNKRQLVMVKRTETGSLTSSVLCELDLLLTINGRIVTNISDLACREDWEPFISMTIIRNKTEMNLLVPTHDMEGDTTRHLVFWGGAVLQEPHKAVLQQSNVIPSKVYVTGRARGSPASTYGLQSTLWITQVNGTPIQTLTDFVKAVRDLEDHSYVRIKTMSFDQMPCVLSVKVENHYWPMSEMVRDESKECGWRTIE